MNKPLQITAVSILSIFSLIACSDKSEEIDIPLSEVPADIINIVQNALPGIAIDEAEKEVKKDTVIYELEGKLLDGKEYEIKITESGTILKIELED